jgi:hypothetical protein
MGFRESLKRLVPFIRFGEEASVAKASQGITRDAWYAEAYKSEGAPPPEDLNLLYKIFSEDPIVNAAITTRVDAILDSGWTVEGSPTAKSQAERLLKRVGFNFKFLRQLFLNALLYRHVFIEIERNGKGEPVSLYILECPYMEVRRDKHGTILSFIQQAITGEEVVWSPQDIVFIKFDDLTTAAWGNVPLKSLYRTITSRNSIEEFLNSLAVTNAWRDIMVFSRTNKDDMGGIIAAMRDSQSNPTFPFVINKKSPDDVFETKPFRDAKDLDYFLKTLDYLRAQILMLLKVPPIMIGIPDDSNRSSSDTQFKAFNIANRADRKTASEAFNSDLFVKLGIGSVEFSWNPIDKRSEKEDVEMAEKLMNMGADPKKVEEFLRKAGLEIPEDFFPERQEVQMMNVPDDAASRPSRQRKNGAPSEKVGTGSEGSTRTEQLE